MNLLLVMLGGAFGSGARYLAGRGGVALLGPALPYGTFFVNITGGFLMGLLVGLLARHPSAANETWRILLGVGVLGGYTTFSSFSLETANMIQRGQAGLAFGYVVASAAGAIGALFAGLLLTRTIPA